MTEIDLIENWSEQIKGQVEMLSSFYEIGPVETIKIGILTNITNEMFPNYKNYESVVSGISQARMVKGVNGINKIESQIDRLLKSYGLDDLNKYLLDMAVELVVMTIDSIYDNKNTSLKKAYSKALNDPDFLYINLKLVVKILAEYLRGNNVEIDNKTLHYMTDAIKTKKRELTKKIINAYMLDDSMALVEAKKEYKLAMIEMLDNYMNKISVPIKHAQQVGMEQKIVEKLGKDSLDTMTSIILFGMKEKIIKNNKMQRVLEFK
ncbi:MAG: hypothetical protein ACRDDH_04955 [Cetobacterium sp.]|uniref:hypothetical protein n=1 Tax=Cetobacterium sp. TaxID=2071632 RepID=UPI003EE534F5